MVVVVWVVLVGEGVEVEWAGVRDGVGGRQPCCTAALYKRGRCEDATGVEHVMVLMTFNKNKVQRVNASRPNKDNASI